MATTSIEAIRRVTVEAREKGLTELADKMDAIARSHEGVVASSTSVEKSTASVEQAFKRTERALDGNVVAYGNFARSAKAVNDALAQGLVTQQRAAELFSLAEVRLKKATGSMDKFGEATSGAIDAGPARHEMLNFKAQLHDIAVSLIGGQSPFTVAAQQGSQLSAVLEASNHSLMDFVGSAVGGAARFLAAWGPVAAVIAAVGATAYATMRSLDQEREARIATTSGLGRLSGVSGRQVGGLAESTQTSGMSLGDAREGVLEFVKAGASATTVAEGMALATQVAATRGVELSDAYKLLAGVIRDPAAAARQLGDEYRILDNDQRKQIATMQASGDRAGATKAVFDALRGVIVSSTDATSMWAKAWIAVKDAATGAADALAKVVKTATPEEQLRGMQAQRQVMERAGQEADQPISSRSFVPPTAPTMQPAPIQGATQSPAPTATDLEAFKQEEVIRRSVLEVTKQQTAEANAEQLAKANIASTIKDQNAAFQEQVAVMMATTNETRALATETESYNAAIRKGTDEETARNAAMIAGNAVRAQASASQAQIIASQQAELSMGSELIAAAAMQGAAGVSVRAGLQEEIAIRQAGLDVTSRDSQTRIENAAALALQKLAMQDVSQATQLTQSIQAQIQVLQLETQMIGANAAERAKALSLLQSEIQARALEAQGFEKSAEAVRQYAAALAQAKANQVQAQQVQSSGGWGGGQSSSGKYETDYHNAQAALLREMITMQTEMDALTMSTGDAAYATKKNAVEMAAYATEAGGARDAMLDMASAAAGMAARLAEAKEAAAQAKKDEAAAAKASSEEAKATGAGTFHAGGDTPLSQRGAFTRPRRLTWDEYQERDRKQRDKAMAVQEQIADAQKAGQQRQLQIASSTIRDQISALNDQKSAIQENTDALEKATTARREELDKQISKLEKALNPSRPDPYAERNPDYFYRFGTQAFKENDPMQALLTAAEAERDGLDAQLEQQKKSADLQQKAIDEQVKAYEAQIKQLERAGNLLSAGVDLSGQEVAGLKAILGSIQGLGDYSRLQAANEQQTLTAQQKAAKAGGDPVSEFQGTIEGTIEQLRRGKEYAPVTPAYGFQKGLGGFSGFFASGGYIPPGSWGVAGEAGPELINRKRAVAGPATVTPIRAGLRPIVVNQTFVSQSGARDLRASRGEIAQRSSSEVRRSLGAR